MVQHLVAEVSRWRYGHGYAVSRHPAVIFVGQALASTSRSPNMLVIAAAGAAHQDAG